MADFGINEMQANIVCENRLLPVRAVEYDIGALLLWLMREHGIALLKADVFEKQINAVWNSMKQEIRE